MSPEGSPLRRLDSVVLAAHLGWPAGTTHHSMAETVVAAIVRWLPESDR